MTALSVQPPFPIMTDIDGQPLEDGYIWIGVANLAPITNPIAVYWDVALTIPATQPIRTRGGYPINSGTPARLYVDSEFSIQVQNRNGSVVYTSLNNNGPLFGGLISSVDVTFLQAGSGAVVRTAQSKMRDVLSVKDFGAVGDGVADDTVAIQTAINSISNSQSSGRAGGTTLLFPEGVYRTTTSILVDVVNVTIQGSDARINHSGANPCFLVGNVSYLTDLAAGYYFFGLESISIYLSNAAGVGIRNNGYRRLGLDAVYVNGGIIGFESEGAFGLAYIQNSVFQSQSGAGSKGIYLKQRNNLFRLTSVAALSGAAIGIHIATDTAENKGIVIENSDVEGCTVGYQVDGNVIGAITFLSCWGENNTTLDINIPNTTGTLKSAISIIGGQFDRGIRLGQAGQTGDIRSSTVQGVDFNNNIGLDILVTEGITVGQNQYGGTATLSFAGQGYGGNARGPNGLLMNRYTQNTNVPGGSDQGGNMLGDIRWSSNRLYVSTSLTNPFWQTTQLQQFTENNTLVPNLPTGATPSALSFKSCITANGGATTITNFTNGFTGQELIILGGDGGNTTIAHGTNIKLPGGSNITLGDNDVVHLLCARANTSLWTCIAYSNNT